MNSSYILDDIVEDFSNYIKFNTELVISLESNAPIITDELLPQYQDKIRKLVYNESISGMHLSNAEYIKCDSINIDNTLCPKVETLVVNCFVRLSKNVNKIPKIKLLCLKQLTFYAYSENNYVELESCKNIVHLTVPRLYEKWSNVLSQCHNLKCINTDICEIIDFNSFKALKELHVHEAKKICSNTLEKLNIHRLNNFISISECSKLKYLECNYLRNFDYDTKHYNGDLEIISIKNMRPNYAESDMLHLLTKLKQIYLPRECDISFVESTPDLEILSIRSCDNSKSISTCSKLKKLIMPYNYINVKYLGNLIGLVHLDCHIITDLSVMQNMPLLEYLHIKSTDNLEYLHNCTKLEVLIMTYLDTNDLRPLNKLPLKTFNINKRIRVSAPLIGLYENKNLVRIVLKNYYDRHRILREKFPQAEYINTKSYTYRLFNTIKHNYRTSENFSTINDINSVSNNAVNTTQAPLYVETYTEQNAYTINDVIDDDNDNDDDNNGDAL
jgi:hypothetical protein